MRSFIVICVFVTLIKLSLMNFYHSTDFEVHRNWLAITHSLPLAEWYTDTTSPWTLDYPPGFAYFEWALSQLAQHYDPAMLVVANLNYASPATVLFQRLSVIGTDALLMLGTWCFLRSWQRNAPAHSASTRAGGLLLAGAILGNVGLLLVDHIHFQYNGVLFGVLLLSCAALLEQRWLCAALAFTVLLCMKHIFLYVAPVFGVYMLRFYVLDARVATWRESALRLAKLAAIVCTVVAIVFAPFAHQLPQVAARLFPFKRGLTHAYWAPNFWALYNGVDKVLATALRRTSSPNAGGLVSQFEHAVLPSVQPWMTFVLSAGAMVPCLGRLACGTWNRVETPRAFIRALVLCAGASFLFGWHVHEKAILMMVIPLSLLYLASPADAKHAQFLAYVAHYSLFPLLDTAAASPLLTPLKYTMWLLYGVFMAAMMPRVHRGWRSAEQQRPWYELVYIAGVQVVFVYDVLVHRVLGWHGRWPFLPLLLCSTYCAVGVLYFWVRYYWQFMSTAESEAWGKFGSVGGATSRRKVKLTDKNMKKKS